MYSLPDALEYGASKTRLDCQKGAWCKTYANSSRLGEVRTSLLKDEVKKMINRPVVIKYEEEFGAFHAYRDDVPGVYGVGATKEDAETDFLQAVKN